MPRPKNHIIAKQTIELVLPGRENGFEWNHQISEFCNKKLNKAINKLFDKYSDDESIIRLDNLEIDLGIIGQTSLDDELVARIVTRLDEQLYKVIKLNNTFIDGKNVQVTRENILESHFNDWLNYLQFGFFAVQAARPDSEELNNEILSFLAAENQAKNKIRATLLHSEITVTRLILQHSDDFLQKLLTAYTALKLDSLLALLADFKLFEAELVHVLEKFSKEAKTALKKSPEFTPVSQRLMFWKEIINFYVLTETNRTGYSKQHLQQVIVNLVLTSFKHINSKYGVNYSQWNKETPWQDELIDNMTTYPLIDQLSENYKKVLQQSLKKEIQYLSDKSKQFDRNIPNSGGQVDNQSNQKKVSESVLPEQKAGDSKVPGDAKKLIDSKTDNTKLEKDSNSSTNNEKEVAARTSKTTIDKEKNKLAEESKYLKTDPADKDLLPFADKELQEANSLKESRIVKRQNIQITIKEGESFYIQNAGVVLLNPFIVNFLKKVELVNEGDFVDDYSREKAVHIIHYLASGQTELPEYDLLLPKLLCGLNFGDPIDRFVELKERETKEAENLLSAAVKHWGALGNASPDALREGFLQREGKLEKVTNGWRLYVEQKTVDILLSKLPFGWGLGTVKFPWMNEVLYVEWG